MAAPGFIQTIQFQPINLQHENAVNAAILSRELPAEVIQPDISYKILMYQLQLLDWALGTSKYIRVKITAFMKKFSSRHQIAILVYGLSGLQVCIVRHQLHAL